MGALASFVAGRRGKWIVLGIWIVALRGAAAAGVEALRRDRGRHPVVPARERRVDRGREDPRRALRRGRDDPGPDRLRARRRAHRGRQAEDRRGRRRRSRRSPTRSCRWSRRPAVPFAPEPRRRARLARRRSRLHGAQRPDRLRARQADWGENVRDLTGDEADGMRILLTGDLGFSADSEEVFGELDTKLLLATVLLVLFLLGAIYRAVLVALTPLRRRLLRLHGRRPRSSTCTRSRARPSPPTGRRSSSC